MISCGTRRWRVTRWPAVAAATNGITKRDGRRGLGAACLQAWRLSTYANNQTQAALANPNIGKGNVRLACAWLSKSPAISKQDPQLEPQPVRMVSSARLAQPFSAASRIWWSVTPLQMQTYTVSVRCWRSGGDRD